MKHFCSQWGRSHRNTKIFDSFHSGKLLTIAVSTAARFFSPPPSQSVPFFSQWKWYYQRPVCERLWSLRIMTRDLMVFVSFFVLQAVSRETTCLLPLLMSKVSVSGLICHLLNQNQNISTNYSSVALILYFSFLLYWLNVKYQPEWRI